MNFKNTLGIGLLFLTFLNMTGMDNNNNNNVIMANNNNDEYTVKYTIVIQTLEAILSNNHDSDTLQFEPVSLETLSSQFDINTEKIEKAMESIYFCPLIQKLKNLRKDKNQKKTAKLTIKDGNKNVKFHSTFEFHNDNFDKFLELILTLIINNIDFMVKDDQCKLKIIKDDPEKFKQEIQKELDDHPETKLTMPSASELLEDFRTGKREPLLSFPGKIINLEIDISSCE